LHLPYSFRPLPHSQPQKSSSLFLYRGWSFLSPPLSLVVNMKPLIFVNALSSTFFFPGYVLSSSPKIRIFPPPSFFPPFFLPPSNEQKGPSSRFSSEAWSFFQRNFQVPLSPPFFFKNKPFFFWTMHFSLYSLPPPLPTIYEFHKVRGVLLGG